MAIFADLEHRRADSWTVALIVLSFLGAASAAGYVIASGKPIPILLTVGVIASIALFSALRLVVWLVIIGTLLVSGPVIMFVPGLDKVGWLFSLLGFFLLGAAFLYAAVGRHRFTRPAPIFVGIAAVIVALGCLSLLYSGGPLSEGVRAIKRYYQYFGLIFILAVVPFAATTMRRWWKFLLLIALIQLPFALFQRIFLVPLREGMPRVVPVDIVVGTMEGSLTGGGSSGVMVLLLLFALSAVLATYREGMLSTRNFVILAFAFMTPVALGQVNLTMILFPIAIATAFSDRIRRYPFRFAMFLLLVAIPMFAFAVWLYISTQTYAGQSFDAKLAEILNYNFGDAGYYGGLGLNRMTVYSYWIGQQSLADPLSFVFGNGLGSSFGGIDEANPGHMDKAHGWMFIGLTTGSSLLWDLGVLGFALYLSMLVAAVVCAYRLVSNAKPGFDRAFCTSLFSMASMLVVMLFYSEAMVSVPSLEVLAALTLGMIAWRHRSEADGRTASSFSRSAHAA